MVSYTTKKKECDILLSTVHDDDNIDLEIQKPKVIMVYNKFKDGVDVVDKLGGNYTVARKITRWTMATLFALQNVAGISAQIVLNFSESSAAPKFRRVFLENLATCVTKIVQTYEAYLCTQKQIIRRALSSGGINKTEKEQCISCGRAKNNYTKICCSQCSDFTCKTHLAKTVYLCETCANKNEPDDEVFFANAKKAFDTNHSKRCLCFSLYVLNLV